MCLKARNKYLFCIYLLSRLYLREKERSNNILQVKE